MLRSGMTMLRSGTMTLAASALVVACGQDRPATTVTEVQPPVFAGDGASTTSPIKKKPDVIFVPTPEPVVNRMLTLAKVGPNDVVYDLGCGDGRIAVAAARDFGARAVCVDVDPQRIREARANVERAGVGDKVEIRQADLFEVDLSPATVVTLYLLESLNLKLRPKLQRELRPGARVVSQTFGMGDWKPAQQADVNGTAVYLWKIGR